MMDDMGMRRDGMDEGMGQGEGGMAEEGPKGGMDEVLSLLDSYIEDPSLATPEALKKLKEKILAAKGDGMGAGEDYEEAPEEGQDPRGLIVAIGKARRGER